MKAKTKKTLMWVGAITAVAVVGYVVLKKGKAPTAAPVAAPTAPSGGTVTSGFKYPVKFVTGK